MLTTTINGVEYEVRVPYEVQFLISDERPVIRRSEPSVRRCDCCDRCPHVESYHEQVDSLDEAIERGWLRRIATSERSSR